MMTLEETIRMRTRALELKAELDRQVKRPASPMSPIEMRARGMVGQALAVALMHDVIRESQRKEQK